MAFGSEGEAQGEDVTLTRAAFVRRLALAGLSLSLLADWTTACSSATFEPSGSILPPSPTPTPTGVVGLLAPAGVIDLTVLQAFSRRTGVALRQATADGETLPAALAGDAPYDVVLAPGHLVSALARRGLLRPLDMALVNNFDYVQGAFRAPAYDRGDPARYSVPFQFRTLGLAVRFDASGRAPVRTWADLWQPRLKRAVRVEALGRPVIGIGLLSLGLPLGSRDRREVDLAAARLIALKANLQESGAAARDAVATVCWSPQALHATRTASADLRFVLPAEGYAIDTDTLCVARATANSLAAHAFLDFCLRPGVQRGIAERLGTQSPEPEAWQYLPPLERSFARSDLQLVHGQWTADLGSFGAVYDKAWATVAREWGRAA